MNYPGIAVRIEPESVGLLVDGIAVALAMPKKNTIAQAYAQSALEKNNVLNQFINNLKGVTYESE